MGKFGDRLHFTAADRKSKDLKEQHTMLTQDFLKNVHFLPEEMHKEYKKVAERKKRQLKNNNLSSSCGTLHMFFLFTFVVINQ